MKQQNITYTQPYETNIKVEQELTAKGEIKPSITISISKKLEDSRFIETIISQDVNLAVEKAKEAFNKLRG